MVDIVYLLQEWSRCLVFGMVCEEKEKEKYVDKVKHVNALLMNAIADIVEFELQYNHIPINYDIKFAAILNNAYRVFYVSLANMIAKLMHKSLQYAISKVNEYLEEVVNSGSG